MEKKWLTFVVQFNKCGKFDEIKFMTEIFIIEWT